VNPSALGISIETISENTTTSPLTGITNMVEICLGAEESPSRPFYILQLSKCTTYLYKRFVSEASSM